MGIIFIITHLVLNKVSSVYAKYLPEWNWLKSKLFESNEASMQFGEMETRKRIDYSFPLLHAITIPIPIPFPISFRHPRPHIDAVWHERRLWTELSALFETYCSFACQRNIVKSKRWSVNGSGRWKWCRRRDKRPHGTRGQDYMAGDLQFSGIFIFGRLQIRFCCFPLLPISIRFAARYLDACFELWLHLCAKPKDKSMYPPVSDLHWSFAFSIGRNNSCRCKHLWHVHFRIDKNKHHMKIV